MQTQKTGGHQIFYLTPASKLCCPLDCTSYPFFFSGFRLHVLFTKFFSFLFSFSFPCQPLFSYEIPEFPKHLSDSHPFSCSFIKTSFSAFTFSLPTLYLHELCLKQLWEISEFHCLCSQGPVPSLSFLLWGTSLCFCWNPLLCCFFFFLLAPHLYKIYLLYPICRALCFFSLCFLWSYYNLSFIVCQYLFLKIFKLIFCYLFIVLQIPFNFSNLYILFKVF